MKFHMRWTPILLLFFKPRQEAFTSYEYFELNNLNLLKEKKEYSTDA